MQSEDNDEGGLTPVEEADEALRKSDRLELNILVLHGKLGDLHFAQSTSRSIKSRLGK